MKIGFKFCILIFCSVAACAQKSFDEHVSGLYEGTVPLINAAELDTMNFENLYLLDTRNQEEFDISHLNGARMIDYEGFKKGDVKDIPRDAKVIVYCSVGYRSERIGEKLQKMGFSDVNNLYGGIFDWKNKGHEVLNQAGNPTDSVHTYNFSWSKWLTNGIKVY